MKRNFNQVGLTTSKRVGLIKSKQSGAAEARRAHNPEVPGSKPGIAMIFLLVLSLSIYDPEVLGSSSAIAIIFLFVFCFFLYFLPSKQFDFFFTYIASILHTLAFCFYHLVQSFCPHQFPPFTP